MAKINSESNMTTLSLVFMTNGVAVLEEDGEQVWASDDDMDFEEEIGNDILDEEDATEVLTYLVEHDILTQMESQMIALEVQEEGSENDETDDSDDSDEDDTVDADFEEVQTRNLNPH